MKYILCFAVVVSLSFALIPWSFRYQSTAGLFEDDYDLLFDPARMPEIQGSRLYTSLANFVTGYENLFSDNSVPFILLGGSTEYMDLYPGFVMDRSSQKYPEWTGLVDNFGNYLYGDGTVLNTTWEDTTGDGIGDILTTEKESRLAYSKDDEADYYLGVAKKFNNLRLGVGFMREEYKSTYTSPSNNYTYDYTVYDVLGSDSLFLDHASSAGDYIYNYTENQIILSGWYDSEDWSLGVRTGYGMFDWKDQAIIAAQEEIYYDPAVPDSFHTFTTSLDSIDTPGSGTYIPIHVALFYNYNEDIQGRFYLGYEMESHKYKDGAIEFFAATSEEIYSGDNTWTYDTTTTTYVGDGSSNTILAGTKHLFKLNPRLNFGIGVLFSSGSASDSTDYVEADASVEVYDNGDTIHQYDDWTTTSTSSQSWRQTTDGSDKSFVFPVGVEFFVLNNALCFRLGATHTINFSDYTYVTKLVDWEPGRMTTVYGNDTTFTSIQDQGDIPASTEIVKATTSTTDYAFGLGWSVNKNFQLDLMGFDQLTDMSNWRLSATLKFD